MKTTDLSPIARLVALAILGSAASGLRPPQQRNKKGGGDPSAPPDTREAAPAPYVPNWDKLPDHVNYVTVARRPGSESGARLWGHRIRPLRHLANGRWQLQAHESPIVLGEAPENTALTTAAPIARSVGTVRCPHWAQFLAHANGRVWATENRPTMVLAPGSRVRVSHASWEGRGGQVPATRHIIAFLRGCTDGVATSEEVREFFGQFDGTELTKAFWARYLPPGARYLVRQSPSRWEAFVYRPVYTGIPGCPWRPDARLRSLVDGPPCGTPLTDYACSVLNNARPLAQFPLESTIVEWPVPPAEQGEIVDATPGGSRKDPDTSTVSAGLRPAEVDPVFPDKPRPISGLTLMSKLYKSEDEQKAGYYSRLLAVGEKNVTVATANGGVIVVSRAELCKTYKVQSDNPHNRLRPISDE